MRKIVTTYINQDMDGISNFFDWNKYITPALGENKFWHVYTIMAQKNEE